MARLDIDTATEVTTSQKISVGLIVATASVVLLATLAAAIYTLNFNGREGKPLPASTPSSQSPGQPQSTDRTLRLPP